MTRTAPTPTEETRTWRRDVAPRDADEGLRALWCEAAQSVPGITRTLMSNLMVFSRPADRRPLDGELQELSLEHPSRILRIEHDPSRQDSGATMTVHVHAIGHGSSRIGIEELVIRVGGASAGLASLVRRFVLGDLPTALWWTVQERPEQPVLTELMAVGRQLVYDSCDWIDTRCLASDALALRADAHRIELADLAWQRIQPFQRALVHATDLSAFKGRLGRIRRVALSSPPVNLASIRLTAGWLISQLHWTPTARRQDDDGEVATCDGPYGSIELAILERPADSRTTAAIWTDEPLDEPAIRIDAGEGAITVSYRALAPPFSLAVRSRSRASQVAGELRDLNMDARFLGALESLARLEAL